MNPDVEEQFILRLPPALAERMRAAVRKGKQDLGMEIEMKDAKHGELVIGDERHKFVVTELPTIVESQKTLNNSTYYKSADIHQMLVVLEPGQELPKGAEPDLTMKHGITPPTRNSRRRFVRHKQKINLTSVETELLKIMRRNALFDNGTERIELIDGSDYEDEVTEHTATAERDGNSENIDVTSEDSERKKKKKKKKKEKEKDKEKDSKEKKQKKKKSKDKADTPIAQQGSTSAVSTPGPASPVTTPRVAPSAAQQSMMMPPPATPTSTPTPVQPAPAPLPIELPPQVAEPPPPLPLPLSLDNGDVFVPELRIAQLRSEHHARSAEISAVNARLADAKSKAAASVNPLMRERYNVLVTEHSGQLAQLSERVQQIVQELTQLGAM